MGEGRADKTGNGVLSILPSGLSPASPGEHARDVGEADPWWILGKA